MSLSELMIDIPAEHERNVFGQFDAYAKKLERTFHVTLIAREGKVKILGEDKMQRRQGGYWISLLLCQKEEMRLRNRM